MTDSVDIDARPTLTETWSARVEQDTPDGPPILRPLTATGWKALRSFVGSAVTVRVERPKLRHSDAQVGYYRGVVLPDILAGLRELAVNAGERCPFNTTDELHDCFKYMWLGTVSVKLPGGETVQMPSTTTTLTTGEYSEYVEKCIRWAGERMIPVRAAGEQA